MSPGGLVESALKRAVVDFDGLDQGLVDALVAIEQERIRAGQPYVGYTEARMSLAKAYRDVRGFDRSVVAPITAPTLLVYGGSDPIIQRSAIDRVAKKRPEWTVEIIDNVGHDPNMEGPDGSRADSRAPQSWRRTLAPRYALQVDEWQVEMQEIERSIAGCGRGRATP